MTDPQAPLSETILESENLHRIELPGKTVYLLGTAHVSAHSTEEVEALINTLRPTVVCVELDEARHKALARAEAWRDLDLFQVVRRKQTTLLLTHLVLSAFQRKMGEQLGVKPGAEMIRAVEMAAETGAELVLADRDIRITLRRTWAQLTFWDKIRLGGQLMMALVSNPGISAEEVEALKSKDMLSQVLEAFSAEFPRAKQTLIDERDHYLSAMIRQAPEGSMVAVVGAGHVPGILKHLENPPGDDSLAPLNVLPRRQHWKTALQWGIPAAVVALIGYGFFQADADVSLEMIKVWVLANGILAALGALLALAHPVTIVVAFVAAPLTSLNPLVAAGWVAGLCEVLLRKPKVRDFESLPSDLTSLGGFWRNGITHILLVVALANLGSSIGTFIGIPLMTSLLG